MFVWKPTAKPQPDAEQYGLDALSLFKQFMTREGYRLECGSDPPEFDPTRRPKYWFDNSVDLSDPEAFVPYKVATQTGGSGVFRFATVYMTVTEAAAVNIPTGEATTDTATARARLNPWPVPVRDLLPNEAIVQAMPGVFVVQRSDMRTSQDASLGRFTPADREVLRACRDMLLAVASKLGA